jgi:hypothetical protein
MLVLVADAVSFGMTITRAVISIIL